MLPLSALVASSLLAIPVPETAVRQAIDRALPALVKGATGHVEQKACFGCHNQTFPALAVSIARKRGFSIDPDLITQQSDHIRSFLTANIEKYRSGQGTGGQVDTAGSILLTLEMYDQPADEGTSAVVDYLLKKHSDRDHYACSSNRPPSEASSLTTTYLAVRGLNHWQQAQHLEGVQKRLEKVKGWLSKCSPKDTEDRVFHLLALHELKMDPDAIRKAAEQLRSMQRADGGWAQLDSLSSDAYATGSALYALHSSGALSTADPAYRLGMAYLVRTQQKDGSWLVVSRSKPFQPYYESGFPHSKNQFISITASGWATAALAFSIPTGPDR